MKEAMNNFWETLPKPFFMLAPLADVTDAAFRRVIASKGKPDVMFTEFVSADGLALAPEPGRSILLKDLEYSEAERPIVAQFFTSNPKTMEKATTLARELGFDGVDINMGCPDRSIEKQGAGAAHIKDPIHAKEIIMAAKQGAGELPVSIKTRIGYNIIELDTWLPALLETVPAAITVHARTRKEMSKVPAQWEQIKRAVELRNDINPSVLIIGNGDIKDLVDAEEKIKESGADGAMLGRAIFGNPWCFSREHPKENISLSEQLITMVEHTELFEKLLPHKNFAVMKKHYKAYVNGFEGAAELRASLMEAPNAEAVKGVVEVFLAKKPG